MNETINKLGEKLPPDIIDSKARELIGRFRRSIGLNFKLPVNNIYDLRFDLPNGESLELEYALGDDQYDGILRVSRSKNNDVLVQGFAEVGQTDQKSQIAFVDRTRLPKHSSIADYLSRNTDYALKNVELELNQVLT